MSRKKFFNGVTTALVTPFSDGQIDFASLKKLVKSQLDSGIQGFVVCGSTGEAATMDTPEKIKLVEGVLNEVAGAVPIIVGCGTFCTDETILLAKSFCKLKIDGLLVVTPYYNKPPQRGLMAHFKKVAESVDKPLILYNVPGRTAINMSAETSIALSQVPNIFGIKEAAGDVEVMKKLVKGCTRDFMVLSGDDDTFTPAMAAGAHGVISVVSHVIPKLCLELARNPAGASLQNLETLKTISKAMFIESNPIPVKWALQKMGIIKSSELRMPLVDLDFSLRPLVTEALMRAGVL